VHRSRYKKCNHEFVLRVVDETRKSGLTQLHVVIAISTAVPSFVVLLCHDLKPVAKRFSLFDAYQSLDNLLNCTYLIRDSRACGQSSVDSKLSSLSRSYLKYRSRIAVK
jgi:hypothetical protein